MCNGIPSTVKNFSPLAGIELGTIRSAGMCLAHWATGETNTSLTVISLVNSHHIMGISIHLNDFSD